MQPDAQGRGPPCAAEAVIRRHLANAERLHRDGRNERVRTGAAHMAVALRAVLEEVERLG